VVARASFSTLHRRIRFRSTCCGRSDFLVVNEIEAMAVASALGWTANTARFRIERHGSGANLAVALTLGAAGALWVSAATALRARLPMWRVVDTDRCRCAFVGVLAAAIVDGAEPVDALRRAVAAGSLACTVHGAQPALPDKAAIDALLPIGYQPARNDSGIIWPSPSTYFEPCSRNLFCAVPDDRAYRVGAVDYTDIYYIPAESDGASTSCKAARFQLHVRHVLHLRPGQRSLPGTRHS